MHVSADCRLMPSPPARVQRRYTKNGESAWLKRCMSIMRMTLLVLPSSLRYLYSNPNFKAGDDALSQLAKSCSSLHCSFYFTSMASCVALARL